MLNNLIVNDMTPKDFLKSKNISEPTYNGVRLVDNEMKAYKITDLLYDYAMEVLKQVNEAKQSDSEALNTSVSAEFKTEQECIDYITMITPFAIAPTKPAKKKMVNPFTSHNAFIKVTEAIGKAVFNLL